MPEFALVAPIFMLLVLGIIDLGRAVYLYNGVSEASREIARATSVHAGSPLGTSPETVAAISLQESLVPGISAPVFHCVDADGMTIPGDGSGGCASGDFVQVIIHAPYNPVALFGLAGTIDLSSSSTNQVQ